jgi:serine/threonine-protein kinase RsbT
MKHGAQEVRVPINSAGDIVIARQKGRALATMLGFSGSDPTVVAAAISEVARNIVNHAQHGEIIIESVNQNGRQAIQVTALDEGPGIPDLEQAMQYGYSTSKGMGVGLPGAKWLMDEFDIASEVGKGTTVTMKKWLR